MKKEYTFSRNDDLTVAPSDELNRKTIDAMEMASSHTCRAKWTDNAYRYKPMMRKVLVCVALICGTFMLMSAGVKIFDYLAYIPGYGITTQTVDNVYTLKEVIYTGSHYIEAISFVPADDEEHRNEWEITVLTNYPTPSGDREGYTGPEMTMDNGDETLSLTWIGGDENTSKYVGYLPELSENGDYTIAWLSGEYTVSMLPLSDSVYSNYEYPVDQGITMVAFPLADGSDKLVFDFIIEPESENMEFWLSGSDHISLRPDEITVTDINGKEYTVYSYRSSGYIVRHDRQMGMIEMMDYKRENIMCMDERLEAPIASIEITSLTIDLWGADSYQSYTLTVPELGETVVPEDNGIIVDTHGIKASIDWIKSRDNGEETTIGVYPKNRGYYLFLYSNDLTVDFEENIVNADISLQYDITSDARVYDGGAGTRQTDYLDIATKEVLYWVNIIGNGDKGGNDGTMPATFGDEVNVSVSKLTLYMEGNWTIDFTNQTESPETAE